MVTAVRFCPGMIKQYQKEPDRMRRTEARRPWASRQTSGWDRWSVAQHSPLFGVFVRVGHDLGCPMHRRERDNGRKERHFPLRDPPRRVAASGAKGEMHSSFSGRGKDRFPMTSIGPSSAPGKFKVSGKETVAFCRTRRTYVSTKSSSGEREANALANPPV